MNPAAGTHPDKEQLAAFGLGRLSAVESGWIENHLDECDKCNQTLVNLNDDTFAGIVRSLANSPAARLDLAPSDTSERDAAHSRNNERTDGAVADVESKTAPTMLFPGTRSKEPFELPVELREHPRYRIVELIGQGGMGDVYRAEHMLMSRPVALKLINSQLISHPQAVERFRREVQAAAQLHHPNIVTAHDAEQAGNLHFLAMEFVDGTDLAKVVNDNGPLPVPTACDYICQAAAGLQHAHERGMVHRDIKPHNLMVTDSGGVKILDFGLANFATETVIARDGVPDGNADGEHAGTDHMRSDSELISESRLRKVAAHLTSTGSVMGTPDYIAPEQARDAHSADIRADIYSLGCTLHFLLSGKPLFETGTVVEKLKAHSEHTPPSLDEIRDDLPAGLKDVIARMLAKDPADRFQAPRDVAAALEPFTVAGSLQPVAARSKFLKRLSIAAAVLTPLVLLAGIVIYLATDTGHIEFDASGIDAPGARVVLLKDGKEFATFDVDASPKLQTIRAGEYEVQLLGTNDDMKMDVWSKRRNSNTWGKPDDPESTPVVLYRGGAMKIEVRKRQPQQLADTTADRELLQGTWVAESGQSSGQPLPADQIGIQQAVFHGDTLRVHMPGGITGEGTFGLRTSEDPKQIWIQVKGRSDGMSGIYKLDGDRLTLCMNQDRRGSVPSEFASPSETMIDLLVLRREGDLRRVFDEDQIVGSFPRATSNQAQPTQTRRSIGILTSPPLVPPGGLPVGKNLIADPSLEDTSAGALPQSWSAWLNDGPDFKCEVVEGGVTGKHCLQISGTGTRGVVFASSIPLDRTRRYALKGQVKVEGEAGTWAVIKLNYFNSSGWLGVDDRVGVTTSDLDWKFFEKTDAVDQYPAATLIVPTCHIEGNGTAWFDDLEVIAYDREKLPPNFDATHGRNNRMK